MSSDGAVEERVSNVDEHTLITKSLLTFKAARQATRSKRLAASGGVGAEVIASVTRGRFFCDEPTTDLWLRACPIVVGYSRCSNHYFDGIPESLSRLISLTTCLLRDLKLGRHRVSQWRSHRDRTCLGVVQTRTWHTRSATRAQILHLLHRSKHLQGALAVHVCGAE